MPRRSATRKKYHQRWLCAALAAVLVGQAAAPSCRADDKEAGDARRYGAEQEAGGARRYGADNANDAKPNYLTGGVEDFDILSEAVQNKLGISCSKHKGGIVIDSVRAGSQAAAKGLKAGDAILDAVKEGNQIKLSVKRNGFNLAITFDDSRGLRLQRETARIDRPPFPQSLRAEDAPPLPRALQAMESPPFKLDARQFTMRAQKMDVLSNYNVELILDRSLSMRRPDCPGGLSRWDWCSMQAVGMAHAIQPFVPSGLTITRFATDFDVHENATPGDVVRILGRHDFQLGTCLYEALANRLESYFTHRTRNTKPLLIGIITDGVPWPKPEPRLVRNVLVDASNNMTDSTEIIIVFFQIGGDDPRGRNYLLDLGNNLLSYGARYQYVQTVTFEQLEETGLANALAGAVQTRRHIHAASAL